jgi:hypothetical protein
VHACLGCLCHPLIFKLHPPRSRSPVHAYLRRLTAHSP